MQAFPITSRVVRFYDKLRRSLQDFPYFGNTEACAAAKLGEGYIAIDVEKKQIRVYDGNTVGGSALPNEDDVNKAIAAKVGPYRGRYDDIDSVKLIAFEPPLDYGDFVSLRTGGFAVYSSASNSWELVMSATPAPLGL